MSDTHSTIFRILDANLNRAREALRVMEEYARFVLDDASLALAIKNARHELVAAIPARLAPALIRHRDTSADVGTALRTDSEYVRQSAASVAIASAKRLVEALRSIEEYGKTIDREFAQSIERLRYRGYELERRLLATARAKERFGQVRLYIIITEALCVNDWFATAQAALDGGADCLQLREKNLTDRELLGRARKLAELCQAREKLFIVNDSPDIAALSGAHGVHLGQDDLPIAAARRLLADDCIVGKSTHTIEQIQAAIEECPDYIAVGPMFPSATKPQDHIAGPKTFAEARRLTALPLVAIGGITSANVMEVQSAVPCCISVCSAVIAQHDVRSAVQKLVDAISLKP